MMLSGMYGNTKSIVIDFLISFSLCCFLCYQNKEFYPILCFTNIAQSLNLVLFFLRLQDCTLEAIFMTQELQPMIYYVRYLNK